MGDEQFVIISWPRWQVSFYVAGPLSTLRACDQYRTLHALSIVVLFMGASRASVSFWQYRAQKKTETTTAFSCNQYCVYQRVLKPEPNLTRYDALMLPSTFAMFLHSLDLHVHPGNSRQISCAHESFYTILDALTTLTII